MLLPPLCMHAFSHSHSASLVTTLLHFTRMCPPCALSQGVAQVASLLREGHGISRADADSVATLAAEMRAAFEPPLPRVLHGLVR
jgi:hypothetical protein